jgi:hypothetical protein
MGLVVKHRLTFLKEKGKHYNQEVRSTFLLNIIKPHSIEIIIVIYVKFDENISITKIITH